VKIYEEEEEPQLKTVENRRWFRAKCEVETSCGSSGAQWPCRIVDISEEGLGIVSTRALSAGEVISLHKPGTTAAVVWANGNRAGLKIRKQD
jgi:hypothetical protein